MSKRFDYIKYDEESIKLQNDFKHEFQRIEMMAILLPEGRARSQVLTKLEESYMWIGKAIRDDQIKRNGSAELQEQRKNG